MKSDPTVFGFHLRGTALIGLISLAFLLSASPLAAQFMARPVNLAYLSQRADVIVQGRVKSVREEYLSGYPNIPTVEVTLDIDQMVRGPAGKTYTFREVFLGLRSREGKQGYKVGQQLFLFLPSPSKYGLSSPVGIEQGRFHIARESGGGAKIINGRGNAGLFRNVAKTATQAGKPLTASQLRTVTVERGPVSLDEFVSLVKSLTTLPRIR
jgi:hypothetical protein